MCEMRDEAHGKDENKVILLSETASIRKSKSTDEILSES